MWQTDTIQLIAQTRGVDAYGDPVITETSREVFCEVRSIGTKEFYQAQAVGLKPELKFILAEALDYRGELLLTYHGDRFSVLRTFRTGEALEITATREVNPTAVPTA